MAAAFVASPYHRPVIGWMGDLDSMTADDIRAFRQSWYVPANAVVVVAGDVDPAAVLALAQKTYGRIPARAVPGRKPRPEPQQHGPRRLVIGGPPAQTPQVKVRTLCGFLSIITYLTENSFSPSLAGKPARLLQKTM